MNKIERNINIQTKQILDNLLFIRTKSIDTVFNDFLDLYICINSFGRMENLYNEIIKSYKPNELEKLSQSIGLLILAYSNASNFDLLGELYEAISSSYKSKNLGQFFTPLHVTDLMAKMTLGSNNNDFLLVSEPAVGSGRNCISVFNINKNVFFNAIDLDKICVKMSIVNFHLYNMIGSEVLHGNTLAFEFWGGYRITIGKPLIKNMYSKMWDNFSSEKKEELENTIGSMTTVIIEKIEINDIEKGESIYFHRIRNNVESYNNLNKCFSYLNNETPAVEKPIDEKTLDILEPVSYELIPQEQIVPEKIQLNSEITVEKINFKKSKKYLSQISIFDI